MFLICGCYVQANKLMLHLVLLRQWSFVWIVRCCTSLWDEKPDSQEVVQKTGILLVS